jgi:hypothetical protein
MNNKKGQSTTIFIILIPLFFLALAFIFDNIMIVVENNRFNSVTKSIIEDVLSNSYNDKTGEVKTLYEKNKYETDLLDTKYENDVLTIYNSHSYSSFFGKIIGVKSYRCEVNYKGYLKGNKVVVEKIDKEE